MPTDTPVARRKVGARDRFASLVLLCRVPLLLTACGTQEPPKAVRVGDKAKPAAVSSPEPLETKEKSADATARACLAQGQVLDARVRFESAAPALGAPCVSEEQKLVCSSTLVANWTGAFAAEACALATPAPGSVTVPPREVTIENRVAYQFPSVSFGQACASEKQTRKVVDGVPEMWSGTFVFDECRVDLPLACTGLEHGQYNVRTRYKDKVVASGASCVAEVQKQECQNGKVLPWTGTFAQEACAVAGKKSCGNTPHDGQETRLRFQASQVAFGQQCRSEEQRRACNDGAFGGWSGTFTFEACTVAAPKACGNLAHGQVETRLKFQAANVPFGGSCVRETQARQCENGVMSAWSGSFQADACNIEAPKACGNTPHDQFELRTRYKTAAVDFGASCQEEVQKRLCTNGQLGAWSGSFGFESCSVAQAASCGSTPHGGNETRVRFQAATVPFGATCQSEAQTRACTNGTLSGWNGSYAFETCQPDAPKDCGALAHSQSESRIRFETESVPAGMACASENQSRTCTNGTLSAWTGQAAFETCVVREPEVPATPTPPPDASPEPSTP